MKRLDKLIIKTFTGPFFLTFVVVVFILLTQYMLKYFDDFVGKDLGVEVFTELILYFSINMTPVALPLAVLLSSLMTFGNLGENFELTAIKGAGISLTRALQPLFFFVILISIAALLSNNYIVPKANLKAYSLLYDIKQKKPALDIQEGVFYGGIPNYKIKVNKKFPDGETLKDVIIYDHSSGLGNRDVILADSGKMYTFNNDRYLMLELFDGNRYSESQLPGSQTTRSNGQFIRNNFDTTRIVFSLASFDLQRTKEEYFASHRRMKTIEQLTRDMDSLRQEELAVQYDAFVGSPNFYSYHLKYDTLTPESLEEAIQQLPIVDTMAFDSSYYGATPPANPPAEDRRTDIFGNTPTLTKVVKQLKAQEKREEIMGNSPVTRGKYVVEAVDTTLVARVDSAVSASNYSKVVAKALTQSRTIKNNLQVNTQRIERLNSDINKDDYEAKKKIAQAVSCLIMFLIGAPLGAIIKKGGLGVPVLISVCFFIAFYVLTEMSRKWADEAIVDASFGVWFPNLVLLPFGILFLIQARLDTRLLETDFYLVFLERIKRRLAFLNRKLPV